jgi:diketogulonate reductase-like aldo/keto reductase
MRIPLLKMKSGHSIPQLGLGTWQLTGQKCTEAVKKALDIGYTHIDTAEIYGNQRDIGAAIRDFDREDLFITSKGWRDNLRFEDTIKSAEKSLDELGTDYLDLLLIHWPNRSVPVKETLSALKKLVEGGKAKSVGVSNFTIRHMEDIHEGVSANQVEFHPYLYQKGLLEFCKKNKIILIAYSPIAQGLLLSDKRIQEIATKNRRSPAQVCLSWILQKGAVAIPKASSEAHLKENLTSVELKLPDEDLRAMDSLNANRRIVNPLFSEF